MGQGPLPPKEWSHIALVLAEAQRPCTSTEIERAAGGALPRFLVVSPPWATRSTGLACEAGNFVSGQLAKGGELVKWSYL